jgi:hypothetical protein
MTQMRRNWEMKWKKIYRLVYLWQAEAISWNAVAGTVSSVDQLFDTILESYVQHQRL